METNVIENEVSQLFFASFDTMQGKNESAVGGKAGRQATMSSLFDNVDNIPKNLTFARSVFGSLGYNPIPYGTSFTATAYDEFKKDFEAKLRPLMEEFEKNPNPDFGLEIESKAKEIVMSTDFSEELKDAYLQAFREYAAHLQPGDFTYLRSSAPSEDGFEASGSGKYDSIPSITDEEKVLQVLKQCIASRFNSTALDYQVTMREREAEFNKPLFDLPFAVLMQRMINSKVAGTVMTMDTQSGNPDFISINLSYGLGESVVANLVNPDKFTLSKKRLLANQYAIVDRIVGSKQTTRQFKEGAHENIEVTDTPIELQRIQCVPDKVVHQIAKMCLAWADIVGYHADIEVSLTHSAAEGWRVYFTQIRPVTAIDVDKNTLITYTIPAASKEEADSKLISNHGEKVGVSKIVTAKVVEIKFHGLSEDALKMNFAKMFKQALYAAGVDFQVDARGYLVYVSEPIVFATEITFPFMEPYLKHCKVILTEKGGPDGHTSIFCRESYIPGGVGIKDLLDKYLQSGQIITVDTTSTVPVIYKDTITYDVTSIKLDNLPVSPIPIGLILADKSAARMEAVIRDFEAQNAGQDIELLRMEMMMKALGIHPLALVHFDDLEQICMDKFGHLEKKDPAQLQFLLADIKKVKSEILEVSYNNNSNPLDWAVEFLTFGITTFASAFANGEVTLRTSDFKSTEYKGLPLGWLFEPDENDAMMGYRGCQRYTQGNYPVAFKALECAAYDKVINDLKYENVVLEFPFVRDQEELLAVKKILGQCGLVEGKNGLKITMMVELPDNFIRAERYFDHVTKMKIGGNDAIQLTKGKARDAGGKNADDLEALKALITILVLKRNAYYEQTGKYVPIGFCGNQPSTNPEFALWLYENKIDSVGVMADAMIHTLYAITNTPIEGKVSVERHFANGESALLTH